MERKIQFMLSQKSTMKTKLENMYLQKRISYGYRKVINMMLLSGVISIIAIGILFANYRSSETLCKSIFNQWRMCDSKDWIFRVTAKCAGKVKGIHYNTPQLRNEY